MAPSQEADLLNTPSPACGGGERGRAAVGVGVSLVTSTLDLRETPAKPGRLHKAAKSPRLGRLSHVWRE